MSEVKKIIISRKKVDQKGNEYALIKISSNQSKRPEIRVIKFKKSPKKSKTKLNNDDNSLTTKTYSSQAGIIPNKQKQNSNRESLKKNLKTKVSDSKMIKNYKFSSFISSFNTNSATKNKNFYIFKSPVPNKFQYIQNNQINDFKYLNHPNLNNYLYSFSNNKNKLLTRNNSEAFKTEGNYNPNNLKSEFIKKRENLNNRIMILAKKNNEYYSKLNNLKQKESKLNNIRIKKIKEKQQLKNAKYKTKFETEVKKQIINEMKEINKDKKKAANEINLKEKKIKKSNILNEQKKIKNIIKKTKEEDYQKNRYNYLKIRKEEEILKNRRRKRKMNLSINKNVKNNLSFNKTMIEDDFKEIDQLKRKYEILKLLNREYNDYIRQINYLDGKRTFTPLSFNRFTKKYFSRSLIEQTPKAIISQDNSTEKNLVKTVKRYSNKNNSVNMA